MFEPRGRPASDYAYMYMSVGLLILICLVGGCVGLVFS